MENQEATVSERPPEGRAARPSHGLADRAGFFIFLAILALCPLPDGSIELIWIAVWGAAACASVLLLSYRSISGAAALAICACGAVVAAFVAVAVLQSESPGPFPQPIWAEAGRLLGIDLPSYSTAVRDAPLIALGGPLLASLLFVAGIVVSDDARRVELVYRVLIAVACISGLIGLAALILRIDALRPTSVPGALTTFFLNKNTTSTYLASAFLLCLALMLERVRDALRRAGGRAISVDVLAPSPSAKRILAALASAALMLAMLIPLAKSRSSLAITLVLALSCGVMLFRHQARSWRILVPLVLFTFAVVYLVAGAGVLARLGRLGLEDAERAEVYRSMVDAIAQHPVLGVGLGTFSSVFPVVRNENIRIGGVWNMGHSTPLELAFTGGLPLAAVVFAFFGLCLVLLVRGVIRRPHDPYILGALLVGLLGALHSMVDFTLQIPGYLMIYAGVAGIGVGRALRAPSIGVYEKVRRRRARDAQEAEEAEEAEPSSAPG